MPTDDATAVEEALEPFSAQEPSKVISRRRSSPSKPQALGRPLRAKLGLDPTSPDIHLGHTLVFEKLRQFQELGHQAVVIIGDFTAAIGDPSGRSTTRPPLSREDILANAETYTAQAFKVLDREKTEIVFNGDWFRKMTFEDVLRLNAQVTMQQMLQREDFKTRIAEGHEVRLHEIQYPIVQGWDSVEVRADVELGGNRSALQPSRRPRPAEGGGSEPPGRDDPPPPRGPRRSEEDVEVLRQLRGGGRAAG